MSETVGAAVINAKHPTRTKHNSYVEVEKFGAIVSYWTIDGFTVHGNKDSRYNIDCRSHQPHKRCQQHRRPVQQ